MRPRQLNATVMFGQLGSSQALEILTRVLAVQVHHVLVHGGPGGYQDFVSSIRTIFGITTELDMHLAFDCADPVSGGSYSADTTLSCQWDCCT